MRFVLVFVQHGVSTNFTRASPAELNYFKAGPVPCCGKFAVDRWPWQHPGESPTYILHEDWIQNTRERPSVKFVKLSINNHIVGFAHKHHINHSIGRTHSWRFSTFFKSWKNFSCEYDRLNGWNSTLQAVWYITHVGIVWFSWTKPTIWLLILSFTQYRSCVFYVLSLWRICWSRSVTPLDAARV